MSVFNERLRELRKRRGITNQKAMAEQLGVSQQQYSMYERERQPEYERLVAIVGILKTTADYLIGRTDDPEPPLILSSEETKIISAYRDGRLTQGDVLDMAEDKFQALLEDPSPRKRRKRS